MTTFDDRERAFETKFARDEEMAGPISQCRKFSTGEGAAYG